MSKLEELLAEMHTELAVQLLDRIKKGTATPSDLNVARQMLKDNGISAMPKKETPLGKLTEELEHSSESTGTLPFDVINGGKENPPGR